MATTTAKQRSDHISLLRQTCQDLVCKLEQMQKLKNQYTRQKMNSDFSDADFTGENEGLKKNDLNHVYTTLDALNALLSANTNEHWQNLLIFIANVKC